MTTNIDLPYTMIPTPPPSLRLVSVPSVSDAIYNNTQQQHIISISISLIIIIIVDSHRLRRTDLLTQLYHHHPPRHLLNLLLRCCCIAFLRRYDTKASDTNLPTQPNNTLAGTTYLFSNRCHLFG
jgi:hypothetical protein